MFLIRREKNNYCTSGLMDLYAEDKKSAYRTNKRTRLAGTHGRQGWQMMALSSHRFDRRIIDLATGKFGQCLFGRRGGGVHVIGK
jgi:hypothetical protein